MSKLSQQDKEKVLEIISNLSGEEVENFTDESKIKEDLGLDSLDEVEVIMELEKEFDCNIPDHDAEEILLVKDYYTALEKNINR